MRPFAQPIKRGDTGIVLSSLDVELCQLNSMMSTGAPIATQYLPLTSLEELPSNTQLEKKHRFPALYHSSHKELIFYQGNAILNTTTGEIYAPYIRKRK